MTLVVSDLNLLRVTAEVVVKPKKINTVHLPTQAHDSTEGLYQAGIPLFYLNVRTNGTMQITHKILKMRLLIFTLAAFIRRSLEPQRLLIQIWRSSVTDACKQSDKS